MCVYNWAIQSEFGLLGKKKKSTNVTLQFHQLFKPLM